MFVGAKKGSNLFTFFGGGRKRRERGFIVTLGLRRRQEWGPTFDMKVRKDLGSAYQALKSYKFRASKDSNRSDTADKNQNAKTQHESSTCRQQTRTN